MQLFAIGCIALFALMLLTTALKKRNPTRQATRKRATPRVSLAESSKVEEEVVVQPELTLEPAQNEQKNEPLAYVVLNVMMPQGQGYGGYALLQTLLSMGLRTGKDKLFHRFSDKDGMGERLFSIATVNQPGTFDFQDINEFFCPGITLFMILKNLTNPSQAFEEMLATAQDIAEELGGEVYNEQREPLSVTDLAALRASIAKERSKIPEADYLEV